MEAGEGEAKGTTESTMYRLFRIPLSFYIFPGPPTPRTPHRPITRQSLGSFMMVAGEGLRKQKYFHELTIFLIP